MRVGFIGLGNMGGPMALNLIKAGHSLIVFDVRREAAKAHLDKGAKWADSPQALARESELILTSLPGPKDVEAVALGPNGIILPGASIGAGTTIGPGSLVTRGDSVPPATRWLGNPITTWS